MEKLQEQIDRIIQRNMSAFRKSGVLTVRPGYKLKNGWITNQPAIVVTVSKKRHDIPPSDRLPRDLEGFPTDVRQATRIQNLRYTGRAVIANQIVASSPEHAEPDFELERDVNTGQMVTPVERMSPEIAQLRKSLMKYRPPSNASLEAVTGTMSLRLSASPDAGWMELREFLGGIKQFLTLGMYDFTSAHVLKALKGSLSKGQHLDLVLDHPTRNPTADQTDEQTQASLVKALAKRFRFAWAEEAHDPMVTGAFFPNAYHIKLAVRDQSAFWLSSGNFNNSNQPDINPFDPKADKAAIDRIAKRSDRDWHVIVEHAGLAKTFQAYLSNDLQQAAKLQASGQITALVTGRPELENLLAEMRIESGQAPSQYFKPLVIENEVIKLQPVLTPDEGVGNYASNFHRLIQTAVEKLYIQTQYIHPPLGGAYPGFESLIQALKDKINQGLDVRIILSQYEATGAWLEKLKLAGIDPVRFVRIQNGVHNKGFVVDAKVVAIGSQNWSGDGVERNRDASLIIYHPKAAQYFESIFLHDWEKMATPHLSEEVSFASGSGGAPQA